MRPATFAYDEMADAELVALFRRRDSGAVRFITTVNNQRLFRAAWAVLRDSAEAEDAVQSGYLRAFAAIGSFEGRSKLSTWLTRIVINEALTRRRAARRRAARIEHIAATPAPDSAGHTPHPAGPQTPEHHVAHEQMRDLLEQAIARLPDRYRIAFILREIEGMSLEEVAVTLEILPATVKTRLHRARLMLRADLAPVARTVLDGSLAFAGDACNALTLRVADLIVAPGSVAGAQPHPE